MEPSFLRLDANQSPRDALAPLIPVSGAPEDLVGTDLWDNEGCLDRPARDLPEGDLLAVHLQGLTEADLEGWLDRRWLTDGDPLWENHRNAWQRRRPEMWRRHRVAVHVPCETAVTIDCGPYRTTEEGEAVTWPAELRPLRGVCSGQDDRLYCLGPAAMGVLDLPAPPEPIVLPRECHRDGDGSGFTGLSATGNAVYLAAGGRVYGLHPDTYRLLPCSHYPAVQLFDTFPIRHLQVRPDHSALLVGPHGEIARLPADGAAPYLLRLRHRGREVHPRCAWIAPGERLFILDESPGASAALRLFDTRTGLVLDLPPWFAERDEVTEICPLSASRLVSWNPDTRRLTVGDDQARLFSLTPGDGNPIPGGVHAYRNAVLQLLDDRYVVVSEGRDAP